MDKQDRIDSFRKEVFQLISRNNIPGAIDQLLQLYQSSDGTYYDDLLLASRRYKDLTDRQMSGLIPDDEANIEKNRITQGLIHIVNQLHTDPVVARHFGLEVPVQEPAERPQKVKKPRFLLWVVPLALLVLGGAYFFTRPRVEKREVPTEIAREEPSGQESPQPADIAPNPEKPSESTRGSAQARLDEVAKEPITDENRERPTPPPPASGPEISSHSSPERAINLQAGIVLTETLLSRKDEHHYTFLADRDGKVDFKLTNLSSAFSPAISILNPDGNRLIGTMARKGEGISTWFRAKKGARYSIRIGSRQTEPGTYKLSLDYP